MIDLYSVSDSPIEYTISLSFTKMVNTLLFISIFYYRTHRYYFSMSFLLSVCPVRI